MNWYLENALISVWCED